MIDLPPAETETDWDDAMMREFDRLQTSTVAVALCFLVGLVLIVVAGVW